MGKESKIIDTKYVDVLDGIRAFAVLLVLCFHFWQQSWISPEISLPFLSFMGIERLSSYYICATGYQFVDMMILLSAFCLFLPYARQMVNKEGKTDSIKTFYKKRMARILPCYYLCVILLFIYAVLSNSYGSSSEMWKDFFSHLTFTQMFWYETYIGTKLNPALWTMCIEIGFYIIFPFIVRLFKKFPLPTYIGMVLVSNFYYLIFVKDHTDNIGMLLNQLPSFMCVFANGMMLAVVFVSLAKYLRRDKYIAIFFTGLSLALIALIYYLFKYQLFNAENGQVWQIQYRYPVSLIFGVFIISVIFSARWFRVIFANRITKFLAFISMNLYIWHQQISVLLKEWRIPFWEGDVPPNQRNDRVWMWEYLVIIVVVSILVAVICTYFVEKPCSKFILNRKKSKGLANET